MKNNFQNTNTEVGSKNNITKKIFHNVSKQILDRSSKLARDVFYHGPGSWQALRTIYEDNPENYFEWLVYPVTLGLEGSKDTRNRLVIYKDKIKEILENGELSGNSEPVKYLDLACGCSLGPITVAKQLKESLETPNIKIKCADIKKDAIEYSKKTAEKFGVDDVIDFEIYRINKVDKVEQPEDYDGVGTHGFFDYKSCKESVPLIKKIHHIIKPNGKIIITNMKEKNGFDLTRFMMRFYGDWYINYKTNEQIGNILYDSGFNDINIIETPKGHHYIATAKK